MADLKKQGLLHWIHGWDTTRKYHNGGLDQDGTKKSRGKFFLYWVKHYIHVLMKSFAVELELRKISLCKKSVQIIAWFPAHARRLTRFHIHNLTYFHSVNWHLYTQFLDFLSLTFFNFGNNQCQKQGNKRKKHMLAWRPGLKIEMRLWPPYGT